METIQNSIDELAKSFNTKMSEFQEDLQKTGSNPTTVSILAGQFFSFKKFALDALDALQQQVTLLGQQQDTFEMRSRRKMLLFHGVKESKQENGAAVVANIITENITAVDFTAQDIVRCHRLGKLSGNKPRPILVKFSSQALRDKVWYSKSSLKGTGLTLSEFLTRGRHTAFLAAREHFGISKCWTRDGFIHIVSPDGSRHRIITTVEVQRLISTCEAAEAPKSPGAAPVASRAVTATSTAGQAARSKRAASKK